MTEVLSSHLNPPVKEEMEWRLAVTTVEAAVRNWIDFMEDQPDHYNHEDINHLEQAWLKVLSG